MNYSSVSLARPGAAIEVPPELTHVGSVEDSLELAKQLGRSGDGRDGLRPGSGATLRLFETLASVAAVDLGAARAIEPHLDALAILDQAGQATRASAESTWGVFAAEGGEPLRASRAEGSWLLDGRKPWCSLSDRVTNALVAATLEGGERQLFAVDLRHPGVEPESNAWHARGLVEIASGPVTFDSVPATPIGDAGWYLDRPGFSWGGMAVAACWYGGAVGIGRAVFTAVAAREEPGDIRLFQLGTIDQALVSARLALADAAQRIDAGEATGNEGRLLAKRVRAVVARAAELTIVTAGHALGPAPLAQDAAHAKRVADLELYARQHHAEVDDASLGRELLRAGSLPW